MPAKRPFTTLDSRGRITIHPAFRHVLEGAVEQRLTEEGLLLRPAPLLADGSRAATDLAKR